MQWNPVHIRLLLLQVLQQRDRRQRWCTPQQRHQIVLPHPRQWVGTGPATGLIRLGLELILINPAGTAH